MRDLMEPSVRYYTSQSSTGNIPTYTSRTNPNRSSIQRKGSQREESQRYLNTGNGYIGQQQQTSRSQEDIRYITSGGSISPSRRSPQPSPTSLAQRRIAHQLKLMAEEEQALNSTDDEFDFMASRHRPRGRSDSQSNANYHPAFTGVDATTAASSNSTAGRYRILTDSTQRPKMRTEQRRASYSEVNLHRPPVRDHRAPSPNNRRTTQLQQLYLGGNDTVRDFNQNSGNTTTTNYPQNSARNHRNSTGEVHHRQLPTPPSPHDRRLIGGKIGGTGQYDSICTSGGNRREFYYEYGGY
ncbi:uncharacterized protein LOC129582700 [Paramacrobiotus metropolitanus]|uniref:uncharacterized protein LOC129582700 n=1 Tax=Paramacrobiotus metropolitanus TaxID=2943436 RepID=UPI0024464BAA|nr:uncharacterized protein LOC129582700 [Paramacrobiotus metropolitanus]